MDPKLLEYFNGQLVRLREQGGAFAQQHPEIAARLGTQRATGGDPYVRFLIESFCQMAARTQTKLDAQFPKFAAQLMDALCPGYVAPTPSIAVARVYPRAVDANAPNAPNGHTVPRGTMFKARVAAGERTACQFRSARDVALYPLEISDARLTGIPADIQGIDRYVSAERHVRGALRIRFRTTDTSPISGLQGLDRLPVYLAGDEHFASHLFELLHAGAVALVIGEPGQFDTNGRSPSVVTSRPLAHEGLGVDEGLLPMSWSKFHAYDLLREYFACPNQFYFFTLTGLKEGFSRIRGHAVEVVVLLDRSAEKLAGVMDAARLALFCTPAINLFSRRTDQIGISPGSTDTLLFPSRIDPLDYEVFSIDRVIAQETPTSPGHEFRPMFATLNNDRRNYGRYFTTRREQRVISGSAQRAGTRTSYIGTELFVSLVDQQNAPWSGALRYLTAEAWVTNRDLPLLVPRNGVNDLEGGDDNVIASVGLVRPPSPPRPPWVEREVPWRLVRLLNFANLPISDMSHRDGGKALRDLLRLHLPDGDNGMLRQIEGLIGAKSGPVERMLTREGPLVFGRGVEYTLTVDETGFSGASPYLLGLIVERFLSSHESLSAFTQTELHSMQRGLIARWPVRMGTREGN
ncbi:type VI secretion system baseplate subunit TssF [Paraburkholderia azotifigens]|uniref:Type VI secretion system baseplate subunit TssF n=1 Tax=Paraburkholderia azotifigens TaxID=2057004 RepID=A0A5C6V694_9BURK|nr:type VI secretion system baseplate subunit TssF [Paraburkholderia azotifigens]TXC80101.1 type VI secretion system baseplate subunit TssF [Paraburkholderia azotifigens]